MHFLPLAWAVLILGVIIAVARVALVLLINGKRRNELTLFSSYMIFGSLVILVGLLAFLCSNCWQYFYIYWVLNFLYVGLEFGVMYEIFVNALKPYSALIDLGKMLFIWASAFLVIVALITAITTSGANQTRLIASVAVLERSLRLIQCGLLMLFFFFEKRLGLSWKSPSVSIALGLGLAAALDLSFSYVKGLMPWNGRLLDAVLGVTFLCILAFWAYCLRQPAAARANVLDSPNRLILQRWNEALAGSVYREPAFAIDSFLPNVEKTVDRVMARKMAN